MTTEQRIRAIERTIDILCQHQLSIAISFSELVEQLEHGISDYSLIKTKVNNDVELLQQIKPLSKQ